MAVPVVSNFVGLNPNGNDGERNVEGSVVLLAQVNVRLATVL